MNEKNLKGVGVEPAHAENAAAYKRRMVRIKIIIWCSVVVFFVVLVLLYFKIHRDAQEKQFQESLAAVKLVLLYTHNQMH